jgi:HTH-type transcriptional regulator / antitoxin HigA
MRTANEITPFIATHPGEIIHDELEARGLSQIDFAKLLGMSRSQLNEIIRGKRNINADLALLLEKALGIDADFWMEAQKNFDLDTARINTKNQKRLEAIAQWNFIEPHIGAKFLKNQQIISGDPLIDLPIIYNVYGVQNMEQLASLEAKPVFNRFRKSEKLAHDPINIIAWVKLVHFKALNMNVGPFNYDLRNKLISDLRLILTENKNTIERVKNKLGQYGIKLIYQEKGDKTPIDGLSFWSEGNPAIGMSLRHHRLDNFAFTLFHELGHVFEHLINNNNSEFIDLISSQEQADYKKTQEEIEANEFATNTLIDKQLWDDFYKNNDRFTDNLINVFAKMAKIHPSIVRGRICHEIGNYRAKTEIDYKIY